MFASLMPDLIGLSCSPAAAVALAARHGFAGLDLRLNRQVAEVESLGVAALARRMREAGLRPGYCSLLPHNLSVEDEMWDRAMAHLPRLADLARSLGYARTGAVILPFHETLAYDEAFEQQARRVDQAMRVLRPRGIALGLEYVSPPTRRAGRPHPFIHDLRGARQLVAACGEGVGLMLDSFHWHCAGETYADLAALRSDEVIVVHVNDAVAHRPISEQVVGERELPGDSGEIDLRAFAEALRGLGYDGPVTAEPTNPRWRAGDDEQICARIASAIRRFLEPVC